MNKNLNWCSTQKMDFDKSEDPVYRLHSVGVNVPMNEVYLTPDVSMSAGMEEEPGVDWSMSNTFIKNLRLCMQSNPNEPLLVHSKTCGGDFVEGMAIFDMLISYPYSTTILNYTHARSMSSLIFQSATKRVMMPHSHFMFHDGSYGDYGNMKTVRSGMEFYEKVGGVMLDIYAYRMKNKGKYSHCPVEEIKKILREEMDKKDDVYLTATETVEWGLADEIFDGNWDDLTKYTEDQQDAVEEFIETLHP
jgi:ATP-dependent protease ClpP protease subunit